MRLDRLALEGTRQIGAGLSLRITLLCFLHLGTTVLVLTDAVEEDVILESSVYENLGVRFLYYFEDIVQVVEHRHFH